ncbi:hypothetical protein Y032_0491g2410 [Ancylostoma ceylanicum]|uniref:Uncharacterized protein n=1 Tax=Ancylostoma ceylanicum TaxID=53326 RepID=A0A016WV64_9BILA|nr:hypothetical protein Y032_0491g2410 [Ancylostoma ceylanicum]
MVVKLSTIDCLVTVDVDGGDPSAASESTRQNPDAPLRRRFYDERRRRAACFSRTQTVHRHRCPLYNDESAQQLLISSI